MDDLIMLLLTGLRKVLIHSVSLVPTLIIRLPLTIRMRRMDYLNSSAGQNHSPQSNSGDRRLSERFDILHNWADSKVLYALLLGRRNPKEISTMLGTGAPTVVDHLNKLRGSALVKRTEKIGKEQTYKVELKSLVEAFLHFAFPDPEPLTKRERSEYLAIMDRFKKDHSTAKILHHYLSAIADLTLESPGQRYPIARAFQEFESALSVLDERVLYDFSRRMPNVASWLMRWRNLARPPIEVQALTRALSRAGQEAESMRTTAGRPDRPL